MNGGVRAATHEVVEQATSVARLAADDLQRLVDLLQRKPRGNHRADDSLGHPVEGVPSVL